MKKRQVMPVYIAGSGGAGIGLAVGLAWLLRSLGVDVPPEGVEVLAAVVGWISGIFGGRQGEKVKREKYL